MNNNNSNNDTNPSYGGTKITSLDDFFAYTQPVGSLVQAGTNALRGINQTKVPGIIPVNKDTQGFVFFTRPMLNLNKWNLVKHRSFRALLTTDSSSVQRYVRCTLDPSLGLDTNDKITSPLVNNKLVFIPLLSNTLLTMSGWPDVVAPTFTSKEGLRKEQWAIIDGTTEINQTFDIDCTFRNMADEPTSMLFSTWLNYASFVFDGQIRPYAGFEARNEIDYTTRIYRIVMDRDEKFVKKIACTIASFPLNDPTGKFFDYDRSKTYMSQTAEINIRFKCMGALYNDHVIVEWFNKASTYANSALADIIKGKFAKTSSTSYEKIPRELLGKLKYEGYPLINTNTYELEWWISKDSVAYKKIMASAKDQFKSSDKLANSIDSAITNVVNNGQFTMPKAN